MGDALNAGYSSLEVCCLGCNTNQTVALEVIRRPKEHAYDRHTQFGCLSKALDAAASNQWTMVDMKKDWKRIFTFE